jgi:hypothetical protein
VPRENGVVASIGPPEIGQDAPYPAPMGDIVSDILIYAIDFA